MNTPSREIQERFNDLAETWQEQTRFHSNTTTVMDHPAIKAIMEIGQTKAECSNSR